MVSAANSLVGSQTDDQVGTGGVFGLSNGNYVVRSSLWDSGATADAGAVTWGNGLSGITGPVTLANSLVGSTASDLVGFNGLTALSNGNYVVVSSLWDSGATIDAGAVTWGNGLSGVAGPVSAPNSLVGSTASDQFGTDVQALSNGNYVVESRYWDSGAIANAGAVTWGSGTSGVAGAITAANSLVGSTAFDYVGGGIAELSNGNYVVRSSLWDSGATADAGAVTWGDGLSGIAGPVSSGNSLVGSTASDLVGTDVQALSGGNYVVSSPSWDNGAILDAGAVSWGFRSSGAVGPLSASNSVRGLAAGGGSAMVFQYDGTNRQLVVGRPFDNIVTLFKLDSVYLPVVSK